MTSEVHPSLCHRSNGEAHPSLFKFAGSEEHPSLYPVSESCRDHHSYAHRELLYRTSIYTLQNAYQKK